jgi:hypothetical protein
VYKLKKDGIIALIKTTPVKGETYVIQRSCYPQRFVDCFRRTTKLCNVALMSTTTSILKMYDLKNKTDGFIK